jgi:hypothetical protein
MITRCAAPAVQARLRFGHLLTVVSAVLLAACGGGGSGGELTNPNSYDLDAAITRAYVSGISFGGLTATAPNGVVMTMALSLAASADALFEGTLRKASVETISLSAPGVATQTSHATVYFGISPFRTYGGVDDSGMYGVFTSTGNLPTAAHVGESGPLSDDVYYADASKTTATMHATSSWEVQSDGTASTAWACSKTVAREVGSTSDLFQTLCFRLNTAGEVLAAKVTLTTSDGTFEFK